MKRLQAYRFEAVELAHATRGVLMKHGHICGELFARRDVHGYTFHVLTTNAPRSDVGAPRYDGPRHGGKVMPRKRSVREMFLPLEDVLDGELIALSRTKVRDGSRIYHRITFQRPPSLEEFNVWLAAHAWLDYDPRGYGPVDTRVAACEGVYIHFSSCD